MAGALRVCIDARLEPSRAGGVGSVLIGLADALSRLEDNGGEEYVFVTDPDGAPWLEPHVGGAVTLARGRESSARPPGRTDALKQRLTAVAPFARRTWRWASRFRSVRADEIPSSDGTVEALEADVVHFVAQSAFLTEIPSIYHPHDLQYVHLPENFTAYERRRRELEYGAFSRAATLVAVTSSWVRDDVVRHFGLPPEKVVVVPWAPPAAIHEEPDAVEIDAARRRLRLPERFVFYPSQAWPHKNHAALFEALALLRDEEGVRVSLVCTGGATAYAGELERKLRGLGLEDQVRRLGFVSARDLRLLYAACDAVVIPTLFEAASGPVWEAFAAGAPVACSNVTSLPAQVGDAGLLFDPRSVEDIAAAVRRLWTDEALRRTLVVRGREQVRPFTWSRTARRFRAYYRTIAGRALEAADAALLAEAPGI